MLARRIEGVLRQYPDPFVAFFTLEVLFNSDDFLMPMPKRTSWGGKPTTLPERVEQSVLSTVFGHTFQRERGHVVDGDWTFTEEGLPFPERLRRYVGDFARRGREWHGGWGDLATSRYDSIVPWVATMVNRWRKGTVPYESILKLRRKASDVADWASATHPNLMSLSIGQVLTRTKQWHDEMKARASMQKAKPGVVIHRFADGWTFERLDERDQLKAEGESQGHCLGQEHYARDVEAGLVEIYSLRDAKGIPHVTVEVDTTRVEALVESGAMSGMRAASLSGIAVQIKGRGNKPVRKAAYCAKLRDAFEVAGIFAQGDDWAPCLKILDPEAWEAETDRLDNPTPRRRGRARR